MLMFIRADAVQDCLCYVLMFLRADAVRVVYVLCMCSCS